MRTNFPLSQNVSLSISGEGGGYDYDSHDLSLTVETRKTRSGDTRRVCTAILSRMTFWYKLLDGQEVKTFVIVAGGPWFEMDGNLTTF